MASACCVKQRSSREWVFLAPALARLHRVVQVSWIRFFPIDSVQLVNVTPISIVYGTYNELVTGFFSTNL